MNLVEQPGGTLLGFRPEHLLPRDHFGGREPLRLVPLIVRRVEYLGSDRYVYGTVETAPGATVIAKLPANVGRAIPEEEGVLLDFAVPERALCYFDAATGARLRGGPG